MNTAEHAEIRHLMGHGTQIPSREEIEDVLRQRWEKHSADSMWLDEGDAFGIYVDGQIALLEDMLEAEQDEREMYAFGQGQIAKGVVVR